jgi:KaiC/GvpD/RAD55 family RecA-like ATPase
MKNTSNSNRLSGQNPSLDGSFLHGLPRDYAHRLGGNIGTGKTMPTTQFILEGRQQDDRCVDVTWSEPSSST